ncbi:thioesterase family protein [Candidatus Poriferisocius sp.]|uniref:thioesterase family protein n=1 Tax=Candidatus Poriferisocius sp. TaxID=3101276 RepID=UPI003B5C1E55
MGDDAVFYLEGDIVVPTIYAQGPWDHGAQHGGAVAGILARAVEQVPTPVPMRVARLTLDMLRRVPVKPLGVTTEVLRTGKRIHTVQAWLHDGDHRVATAVAMSVRTGADIDVAGYRQAEAPLPPPPGSAGPPRELAPRAVMPEGFPHVVEFDRVEGGTAGGTPSKTWVRLEVPFVRGEETSPLVRLMALSDFTSGLGSFLPYDRYVSINPDLTIHVLRYPNSDRIGIDAETWIDPDGMGQSRARLYDETGLCALCSASLFVESRSRYYPA